MKYLKKVSLAGKKKIPDDVKVTLLNENVKKNLFLNNLDYEAGLVGKPRSTPSTPLLHRLWPGIEHFSKNKRQEAISLIKKLEVSPSVQINDNFELVYNGEVQRGTHILQLIKAELNTNQRTLVPGQDVFEHVLLTSPASRSFPDSVYVTPEKKPPRKKRRRSAARPKNSTPRKSPEKSPTASYLIRTRAPKFVPRIVSPISPMRTRRNAKIQESRWK